MSKFFKGLYTAQITPFKDNKIDLAAFEKMLQMQRDAGVDGVVIAGSTGEVPALDNDEYQILLKTAVKILEGKTQVIAGVSSNVTSKAIEIAKIAENCRVDGLMCVAPFYNKAPQRGLIKYFKAIHDATSIPIMLYSVPSRTGIDLSDDTIIELSNLERIIGLKDAAPDIERPLRLYRKLSKNFSMLTGEDSNTVAYSAHSGIGCVSVISNIAPKPCKKLQDLLNSGNYHEALELQTHLIPLCKIIFAETNPIPVKFAASYLGLCSAEVRSPLEEMVDENLKKNIISRIEELKAKISLV